MDRNNKFEDQKEEIIKLVKESIENYLDSRSSSLMQDSEVWVNSNADGKFVVEVKLPRSISEEFRELKTDIYIFISELESDNNISIQSTITLTSDYAESIDDSEFGEDSINVDATPDSYEYDDYYNSDEFVEDNLTIYTEDDIFPDSDSDYTDEDYIDKSLVYAEDEEDQDEDEAEYEPDSKDLVDFFNTENDYRRLNDYDMRRSLGSYDDYWRN